jgi:hypothetical protein
MNRQPTFPSRDVVLDALARQRQVRACKTILADPTSVGHDLLVAIVDNFMALEPDSDVPA